MSSVLPLQGNGGNQSMAREPSLPPEVEEDPQAAAVRIWEEVQTYDNLRYWETYIHPARHHLSFTVIHMVSRVACKRKGNTGLCSIHTCRHLQTQ